MQTLHLRFRDLRATSSGRRPSRWQTPSLRGASKWETASPLPNPLGPTLAVGSPPVTSHQRIDRCPTMGAGLPLASPFREAHGVGPDGATMCRVCPRQTASPLSPYPQPHGGRDMGTEDWQARASESRWLALGGLSFPLRPQRCGARASGAKTADRTANVGALAGVSSGACRQRSSSGGG